MNVWVCAIYRAYQSLKPLSADHYCTINTYGFFSSFKRNCIVYLLTWSKMICVKLQCTHTHFRHTSIYFALNLYLSCCRDGERLPSTLCQVHVSNAHQQFLLSKVQINQFFFFFFLRICTRFYNNEQYSVKYDGCCFRLNQIISFWNFSMHSYAITAIFYLFQTHAHVYATGDRLFYDNFQVHIKLWFNLPPPRSLASSFESFFFSVSRKRINKNTQITE